MKKLKGGENSKKKKKDHKDIEGGNLRFCVGISTSGFLGFFVTSWKHLKEFQTLIEGVASRCSCLFTLRETQTAESGAKSPHPKPKADCRGEGDCPSVSSEDGAFVSAVLWSACDDSDIPT